MSESEACPHCDDTGWCECSRCYRGGYCGCAAGGDAEDADVRPVHPLVALLTEALAVTSLAQTAKQCGGFCVEVVLEWDGLEERTLSVQDGTYRFDDFAAHTHKSTTDPAEARAWLADALVLEVSRG